MWCVSAAEQGGQSCTRGLKQSSMSYLLSSFLARSPLKLIQFICLVAKLGRKRERMIMVKDNQVTNYFSKLDVHKLIGLHRIHLEVLRKLADVIASLSFTIKRSWWMQVFDDLRKRNVMSIFKSGGRKETFLSLLEVRERKTHKLFPVVK